MKNVLKRLSDFNKVRSTHLFIIRTLSETAREVSETVQAFDGQQGNVNGFLHTCI